MAEQLDTLSGLARILSTEPLPLCPMFRTMDAPRLPAEMEKWVGDLYNWLKKLFGKFTAENIITTINQGGGSGVLKTVTKVYHFDGDNGSVTATIDDLVDWREFGILVHMRIADTLDNLQHFVDDPDTTAVFVGGSNSAYLYTAASVADGAFSTNLTANLNVLSDGSLQLEIINTSGGGTHNEGYIAVSVAAVCQIGSSVTSIGNGN